MLTTIESRGLALARGFIVFIMPAVHTVLIYSSDAVKSGWLGTILGFLAEQPGAPLFMLQMGLFAGIGRPKSRIQVMKRFLALLLAGYFLNFLRLVLPYWWAGLSEAFLVHNHIVNTGHVALQLLLVGDILQFAALGYLFCQLVQHLFKNIYLKIILLVTLLIISPFIGSLKIHNLVSQYILGLFIGLPPNAFFPFFPWICYPLAGLIIAQVLKQYHFRFKLLFWFVMSVLLIVGGFAISAVEPSEWNSNFYRLGTGGTLFHLGAAIAWMVLFIFLAQKIRVNIYFSFLEGLSSRITLVYFLQWIIIIWLIPLFGFNTLGLKMSLAAVAANTVASFSLAYHFETLKYRLSKK
ncbi:MAG: hypothetical protein QM640_14960 [Niabella sp.]